MSGHDKSGTREEANATDRSSPASEDSPFEDDALKAKLFDLMKENLSDHREFLQSQTRQVKWGVAVIVFAALTAVTWVTGESSDKARDAIREAKDSVQASGRTVDAATQRARSDLDQAIKDLKTRSREEIQAIVETRLIEYAIESDLKEALKQRLAHFVESTMSERFEEAKTLFTSELDQISGVAIASATDSALDQLADKIADEVNQIDLKVMGQLSVPVGTIVGYLALPEDMARRDDWLFCDGRPFSEVEYPVLAKLLKKSKAPDFRGLFLRGLDYGEGSPLGGDPDRNRTPGTQQADAIASHKHAYQDVHLTDNPLGEIVVGQAGKGTSTQRRVSWTETQALGSSETRPKNAAVLWLIKAR